MAKKKLLSRDDILNAQDLPSETIEVPEWGGWVTVRSMTGTERDEFEASLVIEKKGRKGRTDRSMDMHNIRAKLVSLCLVDDDGKRLFSQYDMEVLGAKSSKALDRCYEAASRLSGIRDEDLEELTEDFAESQDAPSSTSWPSDSE